MSLDKLPVLVSTLSNLPSNVVISIDRLPVAISICSNLPFTLPLSVSNESNLPSYVFILVSFDEVYVLRSVRNVVTSLSLAYVSSILAVNPSKELT